MNDQGHHEELTEQEANAAAAAAALQQQALQQQYLHQLALFWQNQVHEIQDRLDDFKTHELPLARIKRIMKSDEDVKMISGEAPTVLAKACEIFILELTLRAWMHTEENKRKTLQRNDISMAITKTDVFDFLIDIVPREEAKGGSRRGMMLQPTQEEMRAMVMPDIQYYYQLAQQQALVQAAQQQQQQAQAVMLGGGEQPTALDSSMMYYQQQRYLQQAQLQLQLQLQQQQQQMQSGEQDSSVYTRGQGSEQGEEQYHQQQHNHGVPSTSGEGWAALQAAGQQHWHQSSSDE